MAGGQIGSALRQLRQLLGARQSIGGSDEQLLQRFLAQRDDDAFAALVHRHGPIVLGVCRRLLTEPSDVEDAFQATFLILLRKAASIAHPERLGPWLHGVAYRVAVRARLQAARRRASESQVVAMSASDQTAAVAWRELRPLLDEEVNRLPEKYGPIISRSWWPRITWLG